MLKKNPGCIVGRRPVNSKCGSPFALQHWLSWQKRTSSESFLAGKISCSFAETSVKAGNGSLDSEKSVRTVGLALLESLCKKGHVRTCYLFSSFLWAVSLHFPLCFGVRDWLSAHKVGEVPWDNAFDTVDLESPLKEEALTLLNSYFQKHKTYQNTCQDQLSHSILSNQLLPNCNLFLEMWVQMCKTFKAKWGEVYLCPQFAMAPLLTLWSLVDGINVLQKNSKKT